MAVSTNQVIQVTKSCTSFSRLELSRLNASHVPALVKDAAALFTGQVQGHMEQWEYGPSLFPGDPGGGAEHWANLVRNPGRYYLPESDIRAIVWVIRQEKMLAALADVETVIELGPGSSEAISKKTLPFLLACPALKKYIAVDATLEQCAAAARAVRESLPLSTDLHSQDYMKSSLEISAQGKCAMVMWGSSIGNIPGAAEEDALPKLTEVVRLFRRGIKALDLMILSFDTETDQEKVAGAYSEPFLKAQILSILYRLARDGHVTGQFDPRIWRHEPVWFTSAGQCAHVIYPLLEQTINVAGLEIRIPARHRLISNNSYKFSPSIMETAAQSAGFSSAFCLQNGPIAMLIAENA